MGKKVLPGIFLGYALYAMGNRKRDILVAGIEELEILDASKIHARRLNAKEVITSKSCEHLIFPIADGTVKNSGRDHEIRKSTLTRDQSVRSEELSGDLQGSSDMSQQIDETKDDAEAGKDFWSIQGDFIYRHHTEPRVQHVSKEETFLIPLKCIVMTRTTHTNLDVCQESRIEDGLAFFIPSKVLFQLQSLRWFFVTLSFFFSNCHVSCQLTQKQALMVVLLKRVGELERASFGNSNI